MSQPFFGFWEKLKRPIMALSPMDGVTDFACRYITVRHGRPDVVFTEFTTAEGLFYAPERILQDFEYSEIERPIVAQIYGHRPEDFYRATHVVCELGFDGVDINMGCPAKQVTQKNCGAKLITLPDCAVEIIRATRQAILDWSNGQTLEDLKAMDPKISKKLIQVVSQMNLRRSGQERPLRTRIPYSIKTRLGFDSVVIESWMETLLQEQPAAISIHGRTLKQMYKGGADWEAIGRAVQVRNKQESSTLILGNGDIHSRLEAMERIQQSGVDGVLIGRAAIGNPWIFQGREQISREERFQVALDHASYFQSLRREGDFRSLRKHLVGYLRNFPEASSLRNQSLQTKNLEELSKLLQG